MRTTERAVFFYSAIVGVTLLTALYEAIRIIAGPSVLSFGIFTNILANPVGKWNDLSLLFGLSGVLSLSAISLFTLQGKARFFTILGYVISVVALFLTDFTLAWGLFAFGAIAVLGFRFISGRNRMTDQPTEDKTRFSIPLLPLVSAIIAIVFIVSGTNIADVVGTKLGLSNIEVRPSWSATFDMTLTSLQSDPVLGVGPNRFVRAWLLYKPDAVNDTIFWNAEFEHGIGIIPSFAVTLGMLGFFAWIFFLLSLARAGLKSVFSQERRPETPLLFVAYTAMSYLFGAMIFYVPGAALVILAFLSAGIALGLSANTFPGNEKTYVFSEHPRIGFISVLLLILVLLFSIVGVYAVSKRFAGALYLEKGARALSSGDIDTAEATLATAYTLFPHGVAARTYTEALIARMGTVLSDTSGDAEELRTRFQSALGNAVAVGQSAIAYDGTDYQNWVELGRVYEAIVPLKIEGAYENAKAQYEKARALNPKSPAMVLTLARLEAAHNNLSGAKSNLEEAVAMKSNYTEAIFALAQIEAQRGNLKEAITQTEKAAAIAPNDMGIFFQLGFLKYTAKDYRGAIEALERTVILNPVYANAKYFLGLSYDMVGRTSDAIAQFEDIETLNPTNQEVKSILANLKAGNDPFASVVPPEEPPEKRDKPPIEEN